MGKTSKNNFSSLLKFLKDFLTLQVTARLSKAKLLASTIYPFFGSLVQRFPGDIVGKLSILSCLEVPPKPALGSWVDGNCS